MVWSSLCPEEYFDISDLAFKWPCSTHKFKFHGAQEWMGITDTLFGLSLLCSAAEAHAGDDVEGEKSHKYPKGTL